MADLAQDKDFQALPLSDKYAYLADTDPDFKGLSANDKQAYVQHVVGGPAPTQGVTNFEKNRANDSATPGADVIRGFGQGALAVPTAVSKGISKLPVIGPKLIPAEGLKAAEQMSTSRTPGEKLGSTEAQVAGSAIIPFGEIGSEIAGSRFVKPIAQYASENVLPAVRAIPYVGKALTAAEEAPTAVKAAVRGGTTGATVGGIEQAVRTHDPIETLKGAVVGGLTGAAAGAGAYGINKLAAPRPFVSMGPAVPENLPDMRSAEISREPFELEGGRAEAQQMPLPIEHPEPTPIGKSAQETLPLGMPAPVEANPMKRLGSQIEEAAGWKPLEPNVPIGQQRPFGGQVTFRRPPLTDQVIPGETPTLKAPEKLSTIATEEPMRQMGSPPIQPNVPMKLQHIQTTEPSAQASLEERFPDKKIRQLVHANGEEMVNAAKDDPETLDQIHKLTNPDVRQALINSGEDMGQQMVNNRKASGDLSRQAAFKRLLDKGLSPKEIVDLANKPIEGAEAGKALPEGVTIEPPGEDVRHPVKTIRAMKNGQEIGSISLQPEGNQMRVALVSTEAPFQRQGIGENLYRAALDYAKKAGKSGLTSDWRMSTEPEAAAIWKKLGAAEQAAPEGKGKMFVLATK